MAQDEIDLLEDAKPQATGDTLKLITEAAEKMLEIFNRMKTGALLMADLKAEYEAIETHTLPDLMAEAGMKLFATEDGAKFEVQTIIAGTMPSKTKIEKAKGEEKDALALKLSQCLAWLRNNGAESLIKTVVVADVGKDEKLAKELVEFLKEKECGYKNDQAVHGSTLNKFIKEHIAGGGEIDFKLFDIFSGKKIKLTVAKVKK